MKVLFKTADCRTEKFFFAIAGDETEKYSREFKQGGIVQVILRSFDFTLLDELLLLNYSTIDLQCCTNLCCRAE